MKSDLQARNLEMKGEAGKIGSKLNGKTLRGAASGERVRAVVRFGVDLATSLP